MTKQTIIGIIIVILIVTASIGIWLKQQAPQKPTDLKKVTIAIGTGPVISPVHIAFVKEYFNNEGLDLTLQQHKSGKAAFKAVIDGQANLATAADTPIMNAVTRGKKIVIICTIETTEKNKAIVARKDKGLSTGDDLTGKKIGVVIGTNAEFFMESLLILHKISRDKVEVVSLKSNEIFDAVVDGKVDAVSTWNPNIINLQKILGEDGVTFYGEGIYRETFNIVAMQDFVNENPEIIKKVLRALIKAEEFIKEKPRESRKIISVATGMEEASLNELWDIYDFRITLDQPLILILEEQTRWAIRNNLIEATEVPNFLDFIYMDALEAIKPEAVTIIR